MPFRLISYGATDVGLKRQKNEDYFAIVEEEELFILADGMGGHASGQVASRLATEHIVEFMTERCRQPGFQWPYPVHEGASFEEAALSNAIQYANERTFIESMKDSRLEGMGTTICAIQGAGNKLVLAHVGDSRIYRYRNGQVEQVTRDHSLLNHYLDTGTITPEEAKDFKNKNVIIRAVGLKDYVDPEVQVHSKVAGDIYLACSDGLSDLVDDWVMKNTFDDEGDDLAGIAHRLIRLANQAGGKDNITCLLLQVTGDASEEYDEGEVTDPLGLPAQGDDVTYQETDEPEPDAELVYGDTHERRAAAPRTPIVSMPGALTIDNDAPTPREGIPRVEEPPRRRR
jgi:protein phosphatase